MRQVSPIHSMWDIARGGIPEARRSEDELAANESLDKAIERLRARIDRSGIGDRAVHGDAARRPQK
jgi:hypothetical protein